MDVGKAEEEMLSGFPCGVSMREVETDDCSSVAVVVGFKGGLGCFESDTW